MVFLNDVHCLNCHFKGTYCRSCSAGMPCLPIHSACKPYSSSYGGKNIIRAWFKINAAVSFLSTAYQGECTITAGFFLNDNMQNDIAFGSYTEFFHGFENRPHNGNLRLVVTCSAPIHGPILDIRIKWTLLPF